MTEKIIWTHDGVPIRQAILVFSRLANGDAAPIRIIAGPKTKLNRARGIAVDPVHTSSPSETAIRTAF